MRSNATDGTLRLKTASGPANESLAKSPRISAPGSPVVAAPARHWLSPVGLTPALQVPHTVDRGTQSATHSYRLPTMSKAPRADTQLAGMGFGFAARTPSRGTPPFRADRGWC